MTILLLGAGLQALAIGSSLFKNREYELIVAADNLDVSGSIFFKRIIKVSVDSLDSLVSLVQDTECDIVIPTSDYYALLLSRNREYLESQFKVLCAVPSGESVSLVCDKQRFMEFCEEHAIPHPKTIPIHCNDLNGMEDTISFPAIIKPNYSVGAKGITIINSKEEIETKLPFIEKKYGSCTIQEFIANQDFYFNVMLYRYKDGTFSEAVVAKIIRFYPQNAGSSCCCITVNDQRLITICKEALHHMNWVGFADFDVLYDNKGGYKVIEINPRVPACLRIANESGVSFPEIIIDDLLGNTRKIQRSREGIMLRYLGTDILWFVSSIIHNPIPKSWFLFWGKDIFYQDIYKHDPSSWFRWLLSGLNKLFYRLTKKH